ncbi:MAG: rhamnulokinase family protein [Rubrobacteraceae bacterium]|jgi:rhamnulokinase
MSEKADFLAVDVGAESGRVFLGCFDGQRVDLREVHRFANVPVRVADGLHWDVLRIMHEVNEGLRRAVREGRELASVGVDTWGVDFALLDRDGALVSNPYHYRDGRTEGMMERAAERVPAEEVYRTTGIQFIPLNTLYQLLALEDSPLLEAAETLMMMPDLIGYWLTGEKACEYTNATTTQLYDLDAADWAWELARKLGIPERIFPEIIAPGTQLGALLPEVRVETGLGEVPVMATATHDTASAVVAVPADGPFAYISSGTWSLVGVETERPVTTQGALRHNFTNEGGFGGRVRLLRNVMGLWLLQECRRTWGRAGSDYSYEELVRLAEAAAPFGALVEPDHPGFLAPGDMPARLRDFCAKTGQDLSEEPGVIARCVFESLALKYRWVLEKAEEVSGQRAEKVHVVGGGARNSLLCRLTAEATGRPVVAGPVEATVLGNIMVQACGCGYVGSLEEIRDVVRSSVEPDTYYPEDEAARWEEAFGRFSELMDARLEGVVME